MLPRSWNSVGGLMGTCGGNASKKTSSRFSIRMGHPPQDKITLAVQSLTSSERWVREGVPMTKENRWTIYRADTDKVSMPEPHRLAARRGRFKTAAAGARPEHGTTPENSAFRRTQRRRIPDFETTSTPGDSEFGIYPCSMTVDDSISRITKNVLARVVDWWLDVRCCTADAGQFTVSRRECDAGHHRHPELDLLFVSIRNRD